MRQRSRQFGVPILSLFLFLWLGACSGSQQDEEGLEVEGNEQGEQQYEQGDEEGNQQQGNQEEGGDNQYAEEGSEDSGEDSGEGYGEETSEGGDQYAEAEGEGNATENDLQEIIQEMNGQGGEETADYSGGGDVPMETTDAMGGGDAGMATTSAGMGDQYAANPAPTAAAAPALPFQPGGTPAGPGLPEMGSKMPYVVQGGDTLAQISQKVYGAMNRWQEMASLSGLANPSRIYPGDLVYYTLDESSMAFATAYEKTVRTEEPVQQGDTLATIAQRVYGSSTSWKAIWRQNDRIDNPDILKPGTTVFYISSANLSAELKRQRVYFNKLAELKAKQAVTIAAAALKASSIAEPNGVLLADSQMFHKVKDLTVTLI